jgi:hypothetical protein
MNNEEDYSSISPEKAYEMVWSGAWDIKTFQIWFGYCIKAEREEGRIEGYEHGYDEGYEYGTGRPRSKYE